MDKFSEMPFLVIIETQKVKSYLFASPVMRETRGASVLLDLLNRKKTHEILKDNFNPSSYEIIYLGGGSGRILFKDKNEADNFKEKLINGYIQKTTNARVAVEVVERRGTETFTEWLGRGIRMSQENKFGRIKSIPIMAGRWIRPCTSCGQEPAEKTKYDIQGEHLLCRACYQKREEIKALYREIKSGERHYHLLEPANKLTERYTEKNIFTTLAQYTEDGGRILLPQDFNDIGQYSQPANYMGLIYADGNRMGEVIKNIGKDYSNDKEVMLAYRAFSEITDQATRESAVEAVLAKVEKEDLEGNPFLPAEFMIAGGDDLMLVVPAHNAIEVAIEFIELFQEKTQKLQKKYREDNILPQPFAKCGLTTSAGVVLAHSHYPIKDLIGFAGELMKIAKERSSTLAENLKKGLSGGQETGTLDFMIVHESGSESIKDRRKKEYRIGGKARLTERPYTTVEARSLLNMIKELKDSKVPKSKLKALYPVLFQSRMQAQFDSLRIKERLKTTGDLEIGTPLHRLITDLTVFPFRENPDGKWSTPLTELIELYDFIRV